MHLVDAALIGAASGLRATVGVGTLVETTSSGLSSALTGTPARIGAGSVSYQATYSLTGRRSGDAASCASVRNSGSWPPVAISACMSSSPWR